MFENGNDNVCHNQGIFAHRPKLPVAEDCNSKDLKRQVVVMFEDVIWNDNVCHNQGIFAHPSQLLVAENGDSNLGCDL